MTIAAVEEIQRGYAIGTVPGTGEKSVVWTVLKGSDARSMSRELGENASLLVVDANDTVIPSGNKSACVSRNEDDIPPSSASKHVIQQLWWITFVSKWVYPPPHCFHRMIALS